MDITFRDFIAIAEGKQVGTIYHFTRFTSLLNMLNNNFDLSSHNDYISFTRNYNMIEYKNDFSIDYKLGDKRIVRLAIDGDKLSNKYKIEPYLDTDNFVNRSSGENEEIIKRNYISIKNEIKQIDIVYGSLDPNNLINELEKTKLYKKYKFNYVERVNNLKKVKGS